MPSSKEPHNKLRMLHFDLEDNSLRKSETADSDNLISFNTDELLGEEVLYHNIDSKTSCNAKINNGVNIGEQPQVGTVLPSMEPVESRHCDSATEVVYCEIPDVLVRNQLASDYSSQEKGLLGQSSQSDGVSEHVKVKYSRHTELGQVSKFTALK